MMKRGIVIGDYIYRLFSRLSALTSLDPMFKFVIYLEIEVFLINILIFRFHLRHLNHHGHYCCRYRYITIDLVFVERGFRL